MRRQPIQLLLAMGAIAASAGAGPAETWDLADDWSNTMNPNGQWSYNEGSAPIALHWDSWHATGSPGWAPGEFWFPSWVQQVTTGGCWDPEVDPGQIWTHGDKGQFRGNITWTAETGGLYSVHGGTWWIYNSCPGSDHAGRLMAWRYLVNGVVAQSGVIGEGDPYGADNPAAFGGIICLEAGDVLRVEYERITGSSTIAVLEWSVETPPSCRPDLNANSSVDTDDLLYLLAAWSSKGGCAAADLDDNGVVATADLLVLLSAWGPCSDG